MQTKEEKITIDAQYLASKRLELSINQDIINFIDAKLAENYQNNSVVISSNYLANNLDRLNKNKNFVLTDLLAEKIVDFYSKNRGIPCNISTIFIGSEKIISIKFLLTNL